MKLTIMNAVAIAEFTDFADFKKTTHQNLQKKTCQGGI